MIEDRLITLSIMEFFTNTFNYFYEIYQSFGSDAIFSSKTVPPKKKKKVKRRCVECGDTYDHGYKSGCCSRECWEDWH